MPKNYELTRLNMTQSEIEKIQEAKANMTASELMTEIREREEVKEKLKRIKNKRVFR